MQGSVTFLDEEGADADGGQSIDWHGLVITFMTEETDDGSFAWSETSSQSSGRFATAPLPTGNLRSVADVPDSLPFTLEQTAVYNFKRPDPGQPLVVPFERATIVTGELNAAGSDRPLKNIFIQLTEPGPAVFSKSDGTFAFRHSQSRIGFLPRDALGRQLMPRAAFTYPQGFPVDHKLDLTPTVMQPASRAVGKVVDPAGDPVAGATVTCGYMVGPFDNQTTYYTDQAGEFRFTEVIDGADVILTDTAGQQRTPAPVRLVLSDDSRCERLSPFRVGIRRWPNGFCLPRFGIVMSRAPSCP
ncbi:hypothetical protein CA85_10050 [Allorhodopirellula solitaria]|uniref:Nickel uptake substrate-specific transmembrane region n=2 Tax=Allorhodopirellula solitaria TaxID=2527987 RepID=A0A5C5YGJ2_9BACT|nr:hypothetical protein CA85_10050 [Allorhodopirellula solitaria]